MPRKVPIWRSGIRKLTYELTNASGKVFNMRSSLQLSVSVRPENVYEAVSETLGIKKQSALLITDIVELVDMFRCLLVLVNEDSNYPAYSGRNLE